MKPEKILVTGGAGFVGSHLIEELLKKDFEITILDNLSTGKTENLEAIITNKKISFLKGDIRNRDILDSVLKDVDTVFHLAALTSVTNSIKNPDLTLQINHEGTRALLEVSGNHQISRFIYVSSSAVYGESKYLPIDEKHSTSSISPYAESKILAEKACLEFSDKYGMETVIVRPFNIYGPRQRKDQYSGVISIFIRNILMNKRPVIYGDGTQTRDFVYVKDIANGLSLTLENEEGKNLIFNLGTGIPTSINDLASTLIEITEKESLKPLYRQARSGEIKYSYADITRASRILGFKPRTSLKQGLKKLVQKDQ